MTLCQISSPNLICWSIYLLPKKDSIERINWGFSLLSSFLPRAVTWLAPVEEKAINGNGLCNQIKIKSVMTRKEQMWSKGSNRTNCRACRKDEDDGCVGQFEKKNLFCWSCSIAIEPLILAITLSWWGWWTSIELNWYQWSRDEGVRGEVVEKK